MKIDISQEIQNVNNKTLQSQYKKQDPSAFDTILQNSMRQSDLRADPMQCGSPARIGPVVLGDVPPVKSGVEFEAVQRLLDQLESYQQLLADPDANLKTIFPVVGQMEKQAENSKMLVDQLPENNPLRMILEESLEYVHQEVGRFNAGYYVDD